MASLGGLALAVVPLVLGIVFPQHADVAEDNVRRVVLMPALLGLWHHRRTPVGPEV